MPTIYHMVNYNIFITSQLTRTQLSFRPRAVHIWSCYTLELMGNETLVPSDAYPAGGGDGYLHSSPLGALHQSEGYSSSFLDTLHHSGGYSHHPLPPLSTDASLHHPSSSALTSSSSPPCGLTRAPSLPPTALLAQSQLSDFDVKMIDFVCKVKQLTFDCAAEQSCSRSNQVGLKLRANPRFKT